MYQLSSRPDTFWQVIGNAFNLSKGLVFKLIPFVLSLIVVCIIGIILMFLFGITLRFVHPTVLTIIIQIVIYLLTVWVFAAALTYGYKYMMGQPIRFVESYKLPLALYVNFLITAAIVSVLNWIGFYLLVVPGIFVSVLLMFATLIVVAEKQNIVGALKGTILLVWGNWWRTFGINVVGMIIIGIILIIPSLIYSWIMAMFTTPGTMSGVSIFLGIIGFIVFLIFGFIFVAWYMSLRLTIYHDLKLRKHNAV